MRTEPPRRALPRYLRPESFETIRDHLDRISSRLGSLEAVLAEPGLPFTQLTLSDVSEHLDPAQSDALFAWVVAAAPSAYPATGNVLGDRQPSPALRRRLVHHDALADALRESDRAPFYGAFHVDEVRE